MHVNRSAGRFIGGGRVEAWYASVDVDVDVPRRAVAGISLYNCLSNTDIFLHIILEIVRYDTILISLRLPVPVISD